MPRAVMLRRPAALAAAVLALGTVLAAGPAAANPVVPADPTLPTDVTYSATDNVEYLGRFPEHAGTAGGRLSPDGTRFYVTDPRGVYVYDVTDAAAPKLLGSLRLYQTGLGAALSQEDVDTDGEILLVDAAATPFGTAQLQVVDVRDPTKMAVLASVPVIDHTWTCVTGIDAEGDVRGCAFAYGRTGGIVDLRNPARAARLDTTWRAAVGYGNNTNSPYTHDLTEVRPGLVMTAGADALLMDTSDPAAPVRLTAVEQRPRWGGSLGYHSVEWANGGSDPYVVLGTEIAPNNALAGSDCKGENSVIEVWDAREVVAGLQSYDAGVPARDAFEGAEFTRVDAYDAGARGLFVQGQAPAHVLYCAHWMELHPDFDGAGLMAVSYYDRGTRFVRVAADGTMEEVGWIVGADSYSGSVQWVTDDVLYVMDYRRGLEVIRLLDKPATGVVSNVPGGVAATSGFQPPSALDRALGADQASTVALGGVLLGAAVAGVRGRRRFTSR